MRIWVSRLAAAGLVLAVGGALAAALAGFGARVGWWDFRAGFAVLTYAIYALIAAPALGLLCAIAAGVLRAPQALALGVAGLLIGGVALAVPLSHIRVARAVPPIHDISTDTENPPAFVAVVPLRSDATNPVEYGGPDVASQQRSAYPDLEPARFELAPERAFEAARDAAGAMGWDIVDVDPGAGRIEATDTTFWFGFKDDVVIRVAAEPGGGARVDVRSLSRVGGSDIGANAARIRAYLARLRTELED